MRRSHFYRGPALWCIATALCLAASHGAVAAPRFVLEIRDRDGAIAIPGASDAPDHPGAIEVVSFGKGYRPTAGGFPAAETTSLECGIIVDQALPRLLELACARGSSLAQVDLFYLGDAERPQRHEAARMRLEHVQIHRLEVVHGEPNPLGFKAATVALLGLHFSKVTWIYEQLDPADNRTVIDAIGTTRVAFSPTANPNFDDDGDGLHNAIDDDDDGDGIPDTVEEGDETDALRPDADEDLDQDDQTNFQEWLAGTRANDRKSFFAIRSLSVEQTPKGTMTRVAFPVIPDRHYRLLGTANPKLPRADWTEYDAFNTPSEGSATETEVELSPSLFPLDRAFFTVEVTPRRAGE